ncbi:hypothetical protein WJX72_012026 [[Myrmecia] bisecta]|uniref:Glycosyltransferase family 92 protein n=1 Tax=[Myrmecia] bisecta TaxID=41462 RepID=A0AAW1PKW2_9CHLO
MLVVVNHNSTSAAATQELAAVRQVLGSEGIQFTSWTERYSSDAHLKVKLQLLHERVRQPQDWIVIADSDEFINFGRSGLPIQHFLGAVERGGSNWVLGMLVDRVAPDGRLAPVAPAPALFHQFPLNCFVVKRLTGGFVWKTPAFKAYWRSNTGNHFIVQPDKAAQYFGAAPAGVKNSRGGYNGAEDLYALTPYKQHHTRYRYEDEEPQEGGVWEPLRYEEVLAVHHFKWHAGVLQSAADRLAYYKGDIKNTGQPRFQHYTESETILNLLAESQTLPIKEAQCKQDLRVWQDVQAGR